jgi:hypothetical protein
MKASYIVLKTKFKLMVLIFVNWTNNYVDVLLTYLLTYLFTN